MHIAPMRINTGIESFTVPSIEGCLHDRGGMFYSSQNVIRVYDWLSGASRAPLDLEAVRTNGDGLLNHRRLGSLGTQAYAEKYYPGQLLKLEQSLAAVPAFQEMVKANMAFYESNQSEKFQEELSNSTHAAMQNVSTIWAFNASSMFFGTPIPSRFLFETLETLDVLFTCVLTQRNKFLYVSHETHEGDLPEKLFSVAELDRVIGRIHQGAMEGFFPHPETQAKQDGLLDEHFYKQCAMAISAICCVPIPQDYIEEKPTRVYFWAEKVLTKIAGQVPDLYLRPKTKNVVTLTFPKRNG